VTALLALLLTAAPETGVVEGKIHFEVKGLVGTPGAERAPAVVFLERLDGAQPKTSTATMRQKEKQFDPRMLVVTVGSKVEFPNDDLVFHNVFSLSKGNELDLGVYRVGSSKSVKFQNPGVVDVFCNIHPEMLGTVLVLQNDYQAPVQADGTFKLTVPAGKQPIAVYWANGVLERKELEVPAGGKVTVELTLVDAGRARHLNKFGQPYGRYK
jgi:plastocyanin